VSRAWLLLVAAWVATAGPNAGVQAPRPPEVGDMAPAFSLPGSDGKMHALSDHLGRRPVVLAWFPRVFATR
jgi:thioredoxin-dependent peroxiredoxin